MFRIVDVCLIDFWKKQNNLARPAPARGRGGALKKIFQISIENTSNNVIKLYKHIQCYIKLNL